MTTSSVHSPSTSTKQGRIIQNVSVRMRDGVNLLATIFLPEGTGPFPTVLVRTAYNRAGFSGAEYTSRGMALAVQDCRGRYASEGEFYPFMAEKKDGLDTLDWLVSQPWCDGRIGMFGDSYLAATQLYLAPTAHPGLVALNPRFMSGNPWHQAYYSGGALSLGLTFSWLCFEVASRTSGAGLLKSFDVASLLRTLPLLTLDQRSGCDEVRVWRDYVSHDTYDQFWRKLNIRAKMDQYRVPVLLTGGWYDYYPGETFDNYQALVNGAPGKELAEKHRVIVGPWTHGINTTTTLGELDFGAEAIEENDSTTRWLECILKGKDPKDFQKAPIRIFVMGKNYWRDEYEWPLARTGFTDLYLHSTGSTNNPSGEGELSRIKPGSESQDNYTYDPANPVPTLGGNHSIGPYNPGLYELALPGPYDQRAIESREDVLVYTTQKLGREIEVTGPVTLHLFASTSAPDTDFVARLTDVYPDGRSINITEGIIRARFREGNWERPKPVKPGKVLEYRLALQPTSNVFAKNHRIGLDITSSCFPLWDRNTNTYHRHGTGTRIQIARQKIHHSPKHPSRLTLPIIPRDTP